MARLSHRLAGIALVSALCAVTLGALGDETSTGDKLRILYSNRFTFTEDGLPLVTIEIMSHQNSITIEGDAGMVVQPDGEGGPEVVGGRHWEITAAHTRPAVIHQWTVVERLGPEDEAGIARALGLWQRRGYQPHRFEIGTIFGVDGEVIDSREVLIGVAPVAAPRGGAKARQIAAAHHIETSLYPELVRRPQGTLIARSGDTVVRNPSVIWFRPEREDGTIAVANVIAGAGGSQLETRRETRRYFGSVYVTLGSDGKLVVANAVSADRLLAGLVPAEMFADAPAEALAAQAIAARTELLQKIGTRHLTDPFLLCSSQHCQVYSGAGHEHPNTTRAVTSTRGQVLLRDGGGIVDARYSASCGGHSENNENIWDDPPDPSLRGRLDGKANPEFSTITEANLDRFLAQPASKAYCGATRFSKNRYRWTKRISGDELARRIAADYPGVGKIRKLEPLTRGVSGRIRELRIVGTGKTVTVRGDLHIRRLLGGLRSTLFKVSPVGSGTLPEAFSFHGAGFGHGVGMCQLGAIGMATEGHDHGEILHHYYPGSHLQRLY